MKNFSLFLFFSIISISLFAQKVKIDDGFAWVDGVQFIKWEKSSPTEVSLSGLTAENEEIFVQWLSYKDPNQVQKSNPEGYVRWVELNFLDLNLKCEVSSQTKKSLIKLILQNELYVDGVLNKENVERFVKKYGTRFSDSRPNGTININISH